MVCKNCVYHALSTIFWRIYPPSNTYIMCDDTQPPPQKKGHYSKSYGLPRHSKFLGKFWQILVDLKCIQNNLSHRPPLKIGRGGTAARVRDEQNNLFISCKMMFRAADASNPRYFLLCWGDRRGGGSRALIFHFHADSVFLQILIVANTALFFPHYTDGQQHVSYWVRASELRC